MSFKSFIYLNHYILHEDLCGDSSDSIDDGRKID